MFRIPSYGYASKIGTTYTGCPCGARCQDLARVL